MEDIDIEVSEKTLHLRCGRCGRGLKKKQSQIDGFGPTCLKKVKANSNLEGEYCDRSTKDKEG